MSFLKRNSVTLSIALNDHLLLFLFFVVVVVCFLIFFVVVCCCVVVFFSNSKTDLNNGNQSRTNGPINAHLTIAQVMPKYNHNNEKQEALL